MIKNNPLFKFLTKRICTSLVCLAPASVSYKACHFFFGEPSCPECLKK